MALSERFGIYPSTVLNPATVKSHDYIPHSGRFNDTAIPYICGNSGKKRCQEHTCKPPPEPMRPSLDYMAPAEMIRLNNYCLKKRWVNPCYKMVSKYNPQLPYSQKNFNFLFVETTPPFTPLITTSHIDYRDFSDDDVFLRERKTIVDRGDGEVAKERKHREMIKRGFCTPWSDTRYGTNSLFGNHPFKLQPPKPPKAKVPEIPHFRRPEDYRATPVMDIDRQKIRRFPPNMIPNYPPLV